MIKKVYGRNGEVSGDLKAIDGKTGDAMQENSGGMKEDSCMFVWLAIC